MRLNEKTFPSYFQLVGKDPMRVGVDTIFKTHEKMGKDAMSNMVTGAIEVFGQVKDIYYVTRPFIETLATAIPKIQKEELHVKYDKPNACIFFSPDGFNLFVVNPTDNQAKIVCYGFKREGLTAFGVMTTDGKCLGILYEEKENGEKVKSQERLESWLNTVLATYYFIENCEIETKVVLPKAKERDQGVKFFNESKSPFIILNCNWFTTLIRDTPFSVNGHFRWQPCGEKRSKKKLIWIEGFEKSGYKRNAKKQNA